MPMLKKKKSLTDDMPFIFKAIALILTTGLSLACIIPFWLTISISLTEDTALRTHGYGLIPAEFSTEAYEYILHNGQQIIRSYGVTIFITVFGTILGILIMTMLAYALSRPNFPWRRHFSFLVFFTMLFNGGLVPSYLINTKLLHLGNTFWVYVFPGCISAWNIIVMRTFFQGLPEALVESAKVDGASELRIFFQIILPLSKPCIASLAFMLAVTTWNNWNTSLIYIRDAELYSLQYMLQKILREVEFVEKMAAETGMLADYETPTEAMRYATAILAAGPILVIFPFFQKYFTKGLTIGAVKG